MCPERGRRGLEEQGATVSERARRHRTSIVDIDIIIVHRKAGHVSARVQPWVLYRECVLSTGSRAAHKVVVYREFCVREREKSVHLTLEQAL